MGETSLVIFQCPCIYVCSVIQSSLTLCNCMDYSPPGFSVYRISKQEYWSCCHFLPQGIFLTQGSNLHLFYLLHWQADSLPLAPPGKPLCISTFSKNRDQFREGNGNPLQYSCLENPMGRGDWWAAVHGVAKSWTRLSFFTFTFHFHALEKEMATHSSILAWRIPGTAEPGELLSKGLHRVGHD